MLAFLMAGTNAIIQESLNTNLGNNANASVDVASGTISASLSLDKYTITLACLFMVQIFFCFVTISRTNHRVKEIEEANEKQKADFYSFLYQFHKQMTEEDQQSFAQYAKQG